MSIPIELQNALATYQNCRFYRDRGVIRRAVYGPASAENSMIFSTEFERGKSLSFQGHASEHGKDIYFQEDEAFGAISVERWCLRYNWIAADFEEQILHQQPVSQLGIDFALAFTAANTASRGCASIILPHLIGRRLRNSWIDFDKYDNFRVSTQAEGGTTWVISAHHQSEEQSLEVSVDCKTNLIRKVTKVRTFEPKFDLDLLQKAQDVLEQSGASEAAQLNKQAMDLLTSQFKKGHLESRYVFDETAIEK